MALELETKNRMLIEINKKPEDIITAVQNDTNSRYLDVYLYDNGVPINLTGCEVRICAKKPNDTGDVWNDGEIKDAVNGRCQFLLTTGMLATVGEMETQIQIWKDNTFILSTEIFNIVVGRSLLGESSVEESNEYGALVILFQNLYQALYLMEQMVNNFGTAGTIAEARNILNFWQGIEYIAKYVDTTLAQKIDDVIANASVQGVLNLIGTAADTGATDTTGTMMGKLNAILQNSNRIPKSMIDTDIQYAGFVESGDTSGVTKEIFSVTGRGRILSLLLVFSSGFTHSGTITITVDGVSHTFKNEIGYRYIAFQGRGACVQLGQITCLVNRPSNNLVNYLPNVKNPYKAHLIDMNIDLNFRDVPDENGEVPLYPSTIAGEEYGGDSNSVGHITRFPFYGLEFNQSFSVKCNNINYTDRDLTFKMFYTLD